MRAKFIWAKVYDNKMFAEEIRGVKRECNWARVRISWAGAFFLGKLREVQKTA